jgi:hypothetical protein
MIRAPVSPFRFTLGARSIIASRHCTATTIRLLKQSAIDAGSRCFIPADSCFSFYCAAERKPPARVAMGDHVLAAGVYPTNIARAFQTMAPDCTAV